MAKQQTKKIVRLNVGGETFVTAPETLLSAGESFFSSLLSGRHESVKDESGAFFIDRSPKYFDPILHYLRSGVLEIPPGISRTTLLKEAEFYGLQTIVAHIEHIEAEKKKKVPVTNHKHLTLEPKVKYVVKKAGRRRPRDVLPFSKEVGCYVDEDDKHAFMFSQEGKLTFISGDQASTQAVVIYNHPQVPVEWKKDQTHERSFAQFYQSHVQKGNYKMNSVGRGLLITLPGSSVTSPHQHLATLGKDQTSLCVTSFSCTGGSGVFMCNHSNPHHFHMYKLHRF